MDNQHDEISPAVGMCFASSESTKSFYRQYAIRKGFGIKTRNSKKGADGQLRYFILACAREGNHVSTIPTDLKTNPTKRIECPAKMTVGLRDGLWYIMSITDEHCHDLSPSKSRFFRGNKKINMHVRRTIQVNEEAGVRLNKSYRSLVCAAGGYENLSFVERDVRNLVGKDRRTLGKQGDGKALLSYFTRMREYNNNFFYEIDLDDDFHVVNVFWADARSRAAYEYFGDVVSFDTTYLANKYDMPFAPFVGVNHHGQSILLGCGLLSAEDTNSFVWLFQTWLRCMSSRAPQGIVTDQCKAMQNAIEVVFPNTCHRWCLWHIMKKIPEKLKGYSKYKSITNAMKNSIFDSLSVDEFHTTWATFIDKFNLAENDWLTGLFKERRRWVPCFLKHNCWAGMSTTQRSESMNAFFDGYINATTTLQQFVKQYDNALQDKAEKEYEADFRSFSTNIPCGSHSMIERQFQSEYTHEKFAEVQAEFRAKINCCVVNVSSGGQQTSYDILEECIVGGQPREVIFLVEINREDRDVKCSCLLFEFRGIMCRHSLLVLAQERVKDVPPKFVMCRWKKNVRRKYAHMKTSYDAKILQPRIERFDALCKRFYDIAEAAAESTSKTSILYDTMNSFEEKMRQLDRNNGTENAETPLNISEECSAQQCDIRNPKSVPRKGRPRTKRKMSTVERIVKKKQVLTSNETPAVAIHETIDGYSNQVFHSTMSILSSVDITNLADDEPSYASTAINASRKDSENSDNCWPSQLANVDSVGFVSLLTSFDNSASLRHKGKFQDWSYENQENRIAAKKAIRKEWRLRTQESTDLQEDLHELEAPIPELRAVQMWGQGQPPYAVMEQALLRIRVENNIMAIRRARFGMLKACTRFLQANRQRLSLVEEEIILTTDDYLSNSDEE